MQTSTPALIAPAGYDDDRMVELIHKAARIFHDQGYDGTSMNDIAAAMNLTKTGLYHYVESKEELLFKIMTHGMDWIDREVVEPARDISDPHERLRWIIRRHGRQMMEGASAIAIVAEEILALRPAHRKQIMERRLGYFNLVRDALAALQRQGKLRPVDTTVAAHSLFSMLLGLPRWYRPDSGLTPAQVLDHVISLIFDGLLERPAVN